MTMYDDEPRCSECDEELDYLSVEEELCAECQQEANEEREHQRQLRADYQASVL